MRFMVLVKASKASEAGVMPSKKLIDAMTDFNEQLVKAGVMRAGDGLHPSSKAARIKFSRGKAKVTDGPFAETKELIAGFWIVEMDSKAAVIELFSRCPGPDDGSEGELEIRQMFEPSDFPADVLTPETAAREEAMRAEIQKHATK